MLALARVECAGSTSPCTLRMELSMSVLPIQEALRKVRNGSSSALIKRRNSQTGAYLHMLATLGGC